MASGSIHHTVEPDSDRTDPVKRQDQSEPSDCEEESDLSAFDIRLDSAPKVIVRISQHSSFDRDQYIQYQSSLSTQSYLSPPLLHEDSGLGESSPSPEASQFGKSDSSFIIPDSQPLAGSSSYQTTASTTQSTNSQDQNSTNHLESVHSLASAADRSPSCWSPDSSYCDFVRNFSSIYVAESPETGHCVCRSASVPVQNSTKNSPSSLGAVESRPTLVRCLSNPIHIVQNSTQDTSPSLQLSGNLQTLGSQTFEHKGKKFILDLEFSRKEEEVINPQAFSFPPKVRFS